jgi:hypothetical protein
MTCPRLVVSLLLPVATLGLLSGCSRADASEKTGEPAQTKGASSEVTTPLESDLFAELRARPLHAPALRPGAYCPDPLSPDTAVLPGIPAEVARGTGPIYVAFPAIPRFLDFFPARTDSAAAISRWRSAEVIWLSDPSYRGPVLVRGSQVDGKRRLGFGDDTRPELELRLPAGSWMEKREGLRVWGRRVRPVGDWRVAIARVRVREGGCYVFQIDGKSFREAGILFGAIWQP